MSYDIYLNDPETGEELELPRNHQLAGGTYAVGGTTRLALNVTYNYAPSFARVIDADDGIRWLNGKRAGGTIERLVSGIQRLDYDVHKDYWMATDGNARWALCDLLWMALMRPDGVWEVS